MKSDKKMTEDILERVSAIEAEKTHRRKTIYKTSASLGAFALILVMTFTFLDNTPIAPSQNKEDDTQISTEATAPAMNKAFSLFIANAAEKTEEVKIHKESNVSIPLGGILYVKDTKNMSMEEINLISYEVKCRLRELYGDENGWHITGSDGSDDGVAVYFGTADYLKLKISDADAIDSVNLTCGKSGKLTVDDKSLIGMSFKEYLGTIKTGKEISVTGEEYKTVYAKNDGMVFSWSVSDELRKDINNAPDTPLSTVTDTITGTITYTDGTSETFTVTLTFDDNGILTSTYSYNPY
ncbi:MAG: hypothetical protein IKL47_13675 [Clostridia bacterium]|nr:hypothetical protein [Clostridia bacterium]